MRTLVAALTALSALTTTGYAARPVPRRAPPAPAVFVRSVTLAHEHGADADTVRVWRTRLGRGTPHRALLEATLARLDFDYVTAETWYRQALADSMGGVAAHAMLGMAAVAGNRGDFAQSRRHFADAATRLGPAGDSSGMAEAFTGMALTTLRIVGVDSARLLLARAHAWSPSHDAWLRARLGCAALQVEVRAGASVADTTWTRTLDMARPASDRLLAECLFVQAQAFEARGNGTRARALLDTVVVLYRRTRAWNGLASARQWQGSTLLRAGAYGAAREALLESLEMARRSASVNGEAWATLELGNIAQRMGAVGDATALMRTARRLFEESGDETGRLYADRSLAEMLQLEGRLAEADSVWRALQPLAVRLSPAVVVAAQSARAHAAIQRGALATSDVLGDSAAATATRYNMPGWSNDLQYLRGMQAMAVGRPAAARAHWDTLLRKNPSFRGPARFEVVSRWAESQAREGNLEKAWTTFSMAAASLDRWRLTVNSREVALVSMQDRYLDWDRDLGIATLVQQFAAGGRVAEALAVAEWRRLRNAQQLALQRGALRVDATGAPRSVRVQGRDSLAIDAARLPALARARLPEGTAILAYVTGRGGEPTTGLLILRDTIIARELAPIDSMQRSIEAFTAFLRAGQRMDALARSLSASLLAPLLEPLSPGVRRLVIVPDGELHRVPFAALAGPGGSPLIERYAIAIAPSVEDALGSVPRVTRAIDRRSLVIGAPAHMPVNPRTGEPWEALPGAKREAHLVAAQLANAGLLEGAAATVEAVQARMERGGVVLHVATHAVADPESFEANGLVLEGARGADGLLSLGAISERPLPFDLVVLSACSSGDGAIIAGQSLHGLASSALDAGARGVVATRWRVDDAAIVQHMTRFYDLLRASGDAVAALHQMRIEAMRAGVSPAIWANVEYFGDPTLHVVLPAPTPSAWARMTGAVREWLRALRRTDQP